jgi:hypothetical protein
MLALLKKLLGKQDAADLVSREAIDIIKRHQGFNEEQRRASPAVPYHRIIYPASRVAAANR